MSDVEILKTNYIIFDKSCYNATDKKKLKFVRPISRNTLKKLKRGRPFWAASFVFCYFYPYPPTVRRSNIEFSENSPTFLDGSFLFYRLTFLAIVIININTAPHSIG